MGSPTITSFVSVRLELSITKATLRKDLGMGLKTQMSSPICERTLYSTAICSETGEKSTMPYTRQTSEHVS